jgi:NAD(P)H-nitrite reductase large subunit
MAQHHIIIGGGPVATNAIESIRQFESGESQITLICDEPAHSRMALPYWLAKQIPREHTYTADDDFYRRLNVDARIPEKVQSIDPAANTLQLAGGDSLQFDNLLIATGSSPLNPPIPGLDLPGVQSLWSLAHTESLLNTTDTLKKPRVLMIGAGFIGFIMLNAMYKRGWQLAVVEREPHVLPRMLNADGAALVESWLAEKGVELHCGTTVQSISQGDGSTKVVELDGGQTIEADVVIVATGIQPNLGLLDGSGIATDEGILVNDLMQTNFKNIYAGGDVAQGPILHSDQTAMHPIQPTAVDHGRIAGANMAGQDIHYPGSLLMNVLDVCGLQCASFGAWSDSSAETITMSNATGHVYRNMLWHDDEMVGAIFVGRAGDVGMLTDVGMVKGILQTGTRLGAWKAHIQENPFDIRRPYTALKVAQQLAGTTLLGRAAQPRQYRFGGQEATVPPNPSHQVYVSTK